MSNIIPYEEMWQVLICRDCHVAVPTKSLTRHLRDAHKLKAKDYKPLLDAISNLPACQTIEEYPRPLNDSLPIDDLLAYPGYQCAHCDDLLSKSETIAQ